MNGNDWFFAGLVQTPTNVPLRKLRTHKPDTCAGEVCPIHNPSDHPMRHFPQQWRRDRRIIERVCPHGIGHPDPDDLKVRTHPSEGAHGCDGCCHGTQGKAAGQTTPTDQIRTAADQTPTQATEGKDVGMEFAEIMINCARQWLDKAVEAYDEQDYEAVDAACRITQCHTDLADTEMEREHLAMAKERHRQEVAKRRKVTEALERVRDKPARLIGDTAKESDPW